MDSRRPSCIPLSISSTLPTPFLQGADGVEQVGDEQAVDDEARIVGRQAMGSLPTWRAKAKARVEVWFEGEDRAHHLDSFITGHRIEESGGPRTGPGRLVAMESWGDV